MKVFAIFVIKIVSKGCSFIEKWYKKYCFSI